MTPRSWPWLLLLASCSVTIDGEQAERDAAAAAGNRYAAPFADREHVPLVPGAALADWIAAAETYNGDLEAAWYRWLAAIESVPQAATQDTTAMLGVQHRLDGGKALDRSALALMSDAMNNLLLPGRLQRRGAAALAQARTAGAEFVRARLQLQREVTERYVGLALHEEQIRLQERLHTVLAATVPSLRARVGAGASNQPELLAAELARLRADAALARMRAEHPALVAALRAIAGADRDGPAPAPDLAPLQPLRDEESSAIDRALEHNPDLEVRRREHDQALAEIAVQEWRRVPEFSLQAMLGGDGVVNLAGAMTLPFLRDTAIEAGIRQAQAGERAAEAMRRQAGSDTVARVLTDVATLRAVAAESELLQQQRQKLRQMADVAKVSWSAGSAPFTEWAAAEVMRIEVEGRLAELRGEAAIGRARLDEALGP